MMIIATHAHEHLGQSIAYARSNGVVPPWSVKGDSGPAHRPGLNAGLPQKTKSRLKPAQIAGQIVEPASAGFSFRSVAPGIDARAGRGAYPSRSRIHPVHRQRAGPRGGRACRSRRR